MLADRVRHFTESVIRETTRLAQRHGALNLGQGMPDFDPPEEVKEAACKAIRDGFNQYAVTWGAAQLGIGQGVLDAVADGLLEASDDLIVLVAVWVDPNAHDETAVRVANRAAVRKAIGTCVEGRDPDAAQRLVAERDSLRNPFYGGE